MRGVVMAGANALAVERTAAAVIAANFMVVWILLWKAGGTMMYGHTNNKVATYVEFSGLLE